MSRAVALAATGPAAASSWGDIEGWFDLEILQKLVRHTTSVAAAVVLFWLVGLLMRRLLHDGHFKRIVLLIDEFVLFALLAFLGWEIIELLVRRVLEGAGH